MSDIFEKDIEDEEVIEKSKRELDPMEQILTSTSLDDVIVVGEEESDGEEN